MLAGPGDSGPNTSLIGRSSARHKTIKERDRGEGITHFWREDCPEHEMLSMNYDHCTIHEDQNQMIAEDILPDRMEELDSLVMISFSLLFFSLISFPIIVLSILLLLAVEIAIVLMFIEPSEDIIDFLLHQQQASHEEDHRAESIHSQ